MNTPKTLNNCPRLRWAFLAVMALLMGHDSLLGQFRAPNIISANVDAGSYCLGTDLFENLHIAYVTDGVLNLHTLLADGRVTDLLVAADSAQPDLDFFSVSLHLSYLHRSVAAVLVFSPDRPDLAPARTYLPGG